MNVLGMGLFQLVMSVAIAAVLALLLVLVARGAVRRREGAAWGAVLLAAFVAVVWPDSTSRLARFLGVGRGADLASYLTAVAMLVGFWMVYLRLRALRRDVTLLVRRLAIDSAAQTLSQGPARTADGGPPGDRRPGVSPAPGS